MTRNIRVRFSTYLRERFPLLLHGPMVIVFCLSAMLFSSVQEQQIPELERIVAAAISVLILFFQLRVADEFKDHEVDCQYRPQRAVPRGVVSLRELGIAAVLGALIQFGIALSVDVGLVPLLIAVWLYMALMTREFFVPRWLKRKPAMYLLSHMLVMPFIAFYASAFDWLCECRAMPAGLGWLLALSFGAGVMLEVGRKIKDPGTEQQGIETYSGHWGLAGSVAVWFVASFFSMLAFVEAAAAIAKPGSFVVAAVLISMCLLLVIIFSPFKSANGIATRRIEAGSGVIAMIYYLALGPVQALVA